MRTNLIRTKVLIRSRHFRNQVIMHRRTAVGIPAFVAAIVVTAVVVAAAIFAAAPFKAAFTKTVPEISASIQTTTPAQTTTLTQVSTQTTTTTVTVVPTTSSFSTSTGLQRSGPISTYPAAWSMYSVCPGFPKSGNTTTLTALPSTYPNSWNTTTLVTLGQVYQDIITSSAFANIAPGHGWVVYSWGFIQGGNFVMPPNSNDIVGYFILTNTTSPNGYVTAYYDTQTGGVALSALETTVTVACPIFTTSSSSTVPS